MLFCTPSHLFDIFIIGYVGGLATIPVCYLGYGALLAWKYKK